MHDELANLGAALCRPWEGAPAAATDLRAAFAEASVALPAGGFGYRMRSASDGPGAVTQKALLPLPDGETLISRLVRQYSEAGCRRFVALVNHAGQAVEESLGDGEPWGVEIRYSYDPDPAGSGRTGALIHAMREGALSPEAPTFVHNADCHLMRYRGCFPHDLLRAHLGFMDAGRNPVATLAAVDGTPYPYTGMSIRDGRVTDVEMYPFVPVPTHTGITLLTQEALRTLLDDPPAGKENFERNMFPRWAAGGRLAALVVSHRNWVAVDDRKAYRIFSEAVAAESTAS